MSVHVITPPAELAVPLAEAKVHLRVDHDDDNAYIEALIAAVTGHIDGPAGWLGRSLITQTLELRLAFFCGEIALPYPPVQSIVSVTYVDADGAEQVMAPEAYRLIGGASSRRLALSYGESWPFVRYEPESVRIRFIAGYGAAATDVPAPIRAALLLHIGSLYAQRETEVIGQSVAYLPAYEALLSPYRVFG